MVHDKRKLSLSRLKIRVPKKGVTQRPTMPKAESVEQGFQFTGQVQGMRAAKSEEIFAEVLRKRGKSFQFRYKIPVVSDIYGLSGEKEVDFVIFDDVIRPIQLADFSFIHHSAEQKRKDYESDLVVNDYFEKYGGVPVVWLDDTMLQSLGMADNKAREMGLV